MSMTVGQTTFDRIRYDAQADVLYLHVGDPGRAVDFDESPEGHALRHAANGKLVRITIVNAKKLLDGAEPIVITSLSGSPSIPPRLRPLCNPRRRCRPVFAVASLPAR